MGCATQCRLCDRLIISTAVTFDTPNLEINIPAGSYANGGKYCIVVAQAIPDTTTVNAPVVITIGTDATTTYPLVDRCGRQVLASQIKTRTRYSTRVVTTATGGSFMLLSCIQSAANNLQSIPAPAAPVI